MKRVYFALAALAAIFAGCSKEVDTPEPVVSAEKAVTLKASIGDPATRVSSDNAGVFKWQSTDEITVVTDNDAIRQFTVGQITDGTSAEFSGTIPAIDEISYALYPASQSHKASSTQITFHLDENVVWKADASNMPMLATVGSETSFDAVGGVLKLILFNIPADADYLKFSATSKKITGDFEIGNNVITTEAKSNSDNDNELVINFSENYNSSKVFYIPLPTGTIDGFTVALYETLDANPLFSVTSPKSLDITANKLIIAKALDCGAVLWSEDFTGYNADSQPSSKGPVTYAYGEDGTKVYTTQLGSGGASGPELLIKSGNGTFTASNIPTGNATSMTLTFMTNRNLTLSSTTDGISIGDITTNGNARSVSISNSKGATFFNIEFKNPTGNNARIDDIKIINPSSAPTLPSISAPDALTIGVNESSASATVTLSNAVDNLGISVLVTGTNADKFTAAISGTTLTVTATETNSTAADYIATVTLKASGATAKAIAVTQITNLVPNPTLTATPGSAEATVTWTKDAHASSYVAYLHTGATETPATGGTTVTENISTVENDCTLSLSDLTNGTTYHLYVKVNGVAENYSAPTDFAHVSFTPVAAKELVSIELTTNPTQTTYNVNDTFSLTGAVVTATYNDSTTADVTSSCNTEYDFSTMGAKTVTISYTEGGVTKTCDCNVIVAAVDVLTSSWAGTNTGSSYSDWSNKTGSASNAVYAGNSNKGVDYIQLRTTNSNSGIVSTTSGGLVKKVSVVWESQSTAGKTIDVYGKNTAYTSPSDLFNNSNQGTKIGSIVSGTSTELTISDDYEYIGIRSNNGAVYLDEIDITWEPGIPTISMEKSSISDVDGKGVTNASKSGVYTLKFGAKDEDVTVTCDGSVVTAASKNNGAITYTVAANNTTNTREGYIYVQYGNENAHTVTVSQLVATYTLAVTNVDNGTISATAGGSNINEGSSLSVAYGSEVTISQSAADTYSFSAWDVYKTGDSSTKVTLGNNTFTMPDHDVTVSATFVGVPTITVTNPIEGVSASEGTYIKDAYTLHHNATRANVTVSDPDNTVVTAVSLVNEDGKISITVSGNTGSARSGSFKIKYGDEAPRTITVNQLSGQASSGGHEEITSGTFSGTTDALSMTTASGITITQLKGTGSNCNSTYNTVSSLRVYRANQMQFSGKTFTKIEMYYTGSYSGVDWSVVDGGGTVTIDTTNSKVVWVNTSGASTVTLQNSTASGTNTQLRTTKFYVEYN